NDLLQGNAARIQSRRVYSHVILARLAARDIYERDARQPSKAGANGVCGNVAQALRVARIGCDGVARYGKDREGEAIHLPNFGCWRKARGKLRKSRLRKLQRLNDVNIPVKQEIDFGAAARRGR